MVWTVDEIFHNRVKHRLAQLLDFKTKDETYILLAIARKKNNPLIKHEACVLRETLNEANWEKHSYRLFVQMMNYNSEDVRPEDFNFYLMINPRSVKKALRALKHHLADWDYDNTVEAMGQRLVPQWYSSLQKSTARSRRKLFLIDIDNREKLLEVQELIKKHDLKEKAFFMTRNGYHILVEPFNKKLLQVEDVEVKDDDCAFIWCGTWREQ